MNKKSRMLTVLCSGVILASTILGGVGLADRQNADYNVDFYWGVGETPELIKMHTGMKAVNNNAYMSENSLRCTMTTPAGYPMSDTITFKKGERLAFDNRGSKGNKYILQISKFPGQGSVEASGSWSPDDRH